MAGLRSPNTCQAIMAFPKPGDRAAARTLPAAQIISSLHQAVLRFADGTRQLDDLTALVVKRLA